MSPIPIAVHGIQGPISRLGSTSLARNGIVCLPNAAVRRGDVTKVGEMGLDGPFDLVLDLGCFHSLPSEGRDA
jgi:hypothetical protein